MNRYDILVDNAYLESCTYTNKAGMYPTFDIINKFCQTSAIVDSIIPTTETSEVIDSFADYFGYATIVSYFKNNFDMDFDMPVVMMPELGFGAQFSYELPMESLQECFSLKREALSEQSISRYSMEKKRSMTPHPGREDRGLPRFCGETLGRCRAIYGLLLIQLI